ncbi:MAG: acetyl-CoA carboxylase carboxyltransferase subunit alpha [Flavobacteriales bacterium]|nr:acetyl-CoA carboxylase carboxyltransferase subunit alpha [Flavobacteriales bacterium]
MSLTTYLDFEEPIKELTEQIEKVKETEIKTKVDMSKTIADLKQALKEKTKEIYSALDPWQRVLVSRHPDRPYTLQYIDYITSGQWIELHGDRTVKDDKAMIGGFGFLDGQSVMFIGQQKGNTTKLRQFRNFGMANPEGYRKALRLMKLAEKFNKPIVTLIDTPGAFPGIEAEERGQGEAIARNLFEMMRLRVPVICIIIGEGASGGALGIGIGDKVLMLENTWYSVISPESCSSILWRNRDHKVDAANALKLTATDMLANMLVDGIIPEPVGGAHAQPEVIFETVKKEIKKQLELLLPQDPEERIKARIEKFCSMGVVVRG